MNLCKKIFFVIITSLLCADACAQKIAFRPIATAAKRYIDRNVGLLVQDSIPDVDGMLVTRAANQKGFMLTATDDRLPLVIAYSDNENFSTENMPPQVRDWIEGYQQMAFAADHTPEKLENWLRASSLPAENISPLLGETTWGQDNPYNNYCPTINGKHCPTGCVATAITQIMRYFQWPLSGSGRIDYTTSTSNIPVSFDFSSATFNWQDMYDTYHETIPDTPADVTLTEDHRFVAKSISIHEDASSPTQCCIEVSRLNIMGESGYKGRTAMVLSNQIGGIIKQVSADMEIESPNSGLLFQSAHFNLIIPESLPDGSYLLYNVVHDINSLKWSITAVNYDKQDTSLIIEKTGDTFTVSGLEFPCDNMNDMWPAVATLMQAAGAAVKMDYKSNASGANDPNTLYGLKTYLGYDEDMYFASPKEYTDKQWHSKLQDELYQGHPVYYTGQGFGGGHAFVIDGIMKDPETGLIYYHVNWGWNGICNGYYLLNMLRPTDTGTGGTSGSNYSNNPTMLIGMKPDDGFSLLSMTCSGLKTSRKEMFAGQIFTAVVENLKLRGNHNYTGDLMLEMHSISDPGSEPITIYEEVHREITPSGVLSNYYMPCRLPLETPAGEYQLMISWDNEEIGKIDIEIESWPLITILAEEKWTGGDGTVPLQLIAMGNRWHLYPTGGDGEVTLTVDSIVNPISEGTRGELAILICDKDGALISPLTERTGISINGYSVINNVKITGIISCHIPDGEYTLRIGFLRDGDTAWTLCDQMVNGESIFWTDYAPLTIDMLINDGHISIDGHAELDGADTPWTGGISSIMEDPGDKEYIYDLSGRMTNANQPGIYIVKKNNSIEKIIKKKE